MKVQKDNFLLVGTREFHRAKCLSQWSAHVPTPVLSHKVRTSNLIVVKQFSLLQATSSMIKKVMILYSWNKLQSQSSNFHWVAVCTQRTSSSYANHLVIEMVRLMERILVRSLEYLVFH